MPFLGNPHRPGPIAPARLERTCTESPRRAGATSIPFVGLASNVAVRPGPREALNGATPSRCAGSYQLPSVATSSQEFTLSSSHMYTPLEAISFPRQYREAGR
jgi:hypothetical protein